MKASVESCKERGKMKEDGGVVGVQRVCKCIEESSMWGEKV